jgi:hypothetical protein
MTKEEINQFFLDNRTKSADTVNSIYNDPKYASTIFNSSVPLPQLEKNIKQSKGATLEPYDPSWTETARYDLAEGVKNLGVPNYPAQNFAKGMYGNKNAERMIDQFGFLDAAQMFVPSLIPPMMMLYGNEAYRGFDKAINKEEQDWTDYISPVMDSVGLGVQGYFVGKSLKEPVKNFFQSVKNKFTKTPKSSFNTTDADFGALQNLIEANETKKLSGPTIYNQNKVLANTANKQPSMAITDPKVVDDLGFYSEAERQTKLLQQNKGGGEQFKGMLLNKGVKADELDELGLIELFKQPKVTKQEILDTIEFNKVKLIETKRTGKGVDADDFDDETFTDIRREDGTTFTTADEVTEAYDTGKYIDTEITYDGMYDGTVNTHLPTGYKTLYLRKSGHDGENLQDIYLTFKPDADVNDWRNSVEAENYVAKIKQRNEIDNLDADFLEKENLQLEDFDYIIQDEASFSFDEAKVRLRAAAINSGDYNPDEYTRFGNSTQPGGTNYKEYVLSLPPKNKSQTYQSGEDFQYKTHFPEYNPVFHIRTKDRTTPDGKKVLYVEELQSDWGQQGRKKGFKEGKKYDENLAKHTKLRDEVHGFKDQEIYLDAKEQEILYELKNPGKPPIRIPLNEQGIREIGFSRYDANNLQDTFDESKLDFSSSRMPKEYKTMKVSDYIDFIRSEMIAKDTFGVPREMKFADIDKADQTNLIMDYVITSMPNIKYKIDSNRFGNQAEFSDYLDDLNNNLLAASAKLSSRVPDAPFVTDTEKWTGLAMKRLIKLAEEGGYDHIAFSPGDVQFDRWREKGLKKYYDEIIPSVAQDVTRKMSDKSSNMKTTTRDLEVQIPSERSIGISRGDGKYFVNIQGSDKPIDNKFFNTREEAYDFADMVDEQRTNQKTFAINITPKVRDTARSGQAMFSLAAGLTAGASALSNQDIGALGSLPNDGT